MLIRFTLNDANIRFSNYKKLSMLISIILIIFSICIITLLGLNLGIDFTGGISIELESPKSIDSDIVYALKKNGFIVNSLIEGNNLKIQFKGKENSNMIKKIKNILEQELGGSNNSSINYRKIDYIGPQVGSKQIFEGILSILVALIGIFFYIWFRFNWQCGISGVIALIHDVIITVGFVSLVGKEFNTYSVTALLTIVGYSINNSVVIYDRIREYLVSCDKYNKMSYEEVVDASVNTTIFRTILTLSTTLLGTLPLILICRGVVRDFSLIIFFGIIIGTCSAIFISAPILTCRILTIKKNYIS